MISSSETMVLANPDVVNEFFKLSSSQAFKSIAMQLDTTHSECHQHYGMGRWTDSCEIHESIHLMVHASAFFRLSSIL